MTDKTDTPLTDALQAQWLAYREYEEEWGEDARKRPNMEMHELAKLLEAKLAEAEKERDYWQNETDKAINGSMQLSRQLAEARKDSERLEAVFSSDWLYVDFEYWNPGKERYDTRMVNSRESLDEAIAELRNGGDAAIRNSQTENGGAE